MRIIMEVLLDGRIAALASKPDGEDDGGSTKALTRVSLVSKDRSSTDVELCPICQNVFYFNEPTTPTHRVIDVLQAAEQGCGCCQLLRRAFEEHSHRDYVKIAMTAESVEHEARCSILKPWTGGLLFKWSNSRDETYMICWIEIVSTSKIPRLATHAFDAQLLEPPAEELYPTRSSTRDNLSLIQTWLQHCDSQHPICNLQPDVKHFLPTRLLEINQRSIILRNGNDLPRGTSYTTLSHCWGNIDLTQLCSDSPLLKGKCLLRNELPITFQHAVSVAEHLGLRYVWIDSLCIIQDSSQDREYECSRMWEVYGSSYLTIAATASMDSSEGLFRQYDAGGPVPCKITPTWDDLSSKYGSPELGYHFLYRSDLVKSIYDSPLCRRAWVLQERFLSPRIIHFAANQIWWECRESCASETYPQGVPDILDGMRKQTFDPARLAQAGNLNECYRAWNSCVEVYSKCGLSQPEDKLVALAGIARQMGQALESCGQPDIYLAGLWKSRLPVELLWKVDRSCQIKRSPTYRAPSWSWASFDGKISFRGGGRPEDPFYTEVLSHQISTTFDPFGAVGASMIRLRGPLVRVILGVKEDPAYTSSDSLRLLTGPSSEFKWRISFDDDRLRRPGSSMEVYALAICRNSSNHSEGLVLCPSNTYKKPAEHLDGRFVRLGTFNIQTKELEKVWELTRDVKDPDLTYEEDNGNGYYTIILE